MTVVEVNKWCGVQVVAGADPDLQLGSPHYVMGVSGRAPNAVRVRGTAETDDIFLANYHINYGILDYKILGAKVHSQIGWGIGSMAGLLPLDPPLAGRTFQRITPKSRTLEE